MKAKISEENNTSGGLEFKLDDDGTISLEYLKNAFSNATGLKFMNITTNSWSW
jgi:hypothetical protein